MHGKKGCLLRGKLRASESETISLQELTVCDSENQHLANRSLLYRVQLCTAEEAEHCSPRQLDQRMVMACAAQTTDHKIMDQMRMARHYYSITVSLSFT